MMRFKLVVGALAVAALVGSPLAAQAKSHKHMKHQSSMSSSKSSSKTTTGANMKSSKPTAANPSSQGNAGPGTKQ